jgi:uncharacterized protein (TIGR02453 family)
VTFNGWPSGALEFYAGLEADNSKSYWQAHKTQYDDLVKAPFQELSPLVEREFGPLKLFRPNRDIRFSKDKSPYKTAAAAVTEGEGGTSYYVQLSAAGLYAGSGYYHLQPDQLEQFRRAAADAKSGPQLAQAVSALRKQRYEVDSRESLKRVPRGFDADHPRAELLRMKGIHVGRTFGAPRWVHTKAAADRVMTAWRDARPVNRWLDRHVGPSTLAPPEPDRP